MWWNVRTRPTPFLDRAVPGPAPPVMPAYSSKREDAMARFRFDSGDVECRRPAASRCDPVPRTYRHRLGGIAMRISFDTQEDSYEDALAVLRRAYGRRGPAPKRDESRSGSEAEKPEKKAASRKPNNSAASPSDSRLGSAEAGSARGELSAPPMRQTRSTRESATGKVRP